VLSGDTVCAKTGAATAAAKVTHRSCLFMSNSRSWIARPEPGKASWYFIPKAGAARDQIEAHCLLRSVDGVAFVV